MRNLIIYSTYGDESPLFSELAKLWTFPSLHSTHSEIAACTKFFKLSIQGKTSTVSIESDTTKETIELDPCLVIPTNHIGYSSSRVWSKLEHKRWIERDLAFYSWLLSREQAPFYLMFHSITSVVDYKSIISYTSLLESDSPLIASHPLWVSDTSVNSDGKFLGISGALWILSSEIIQLLCERKDSLVKDIVFDVWMSTVLSAELRTYPRRYFGRCDINIFLEDFCKALSSSGDSNKVLADPVFISELRQRIHTVIKAKSNDGIFHFRVNSMPLFGTSLVRDQFDFLVHQLVREAVDNSRTDPLKIEKAGWIQALNGGYIC